MRTLRILMKLKTLRILFAAVLVIMSLSSCSSSNQDQPVPEQDQPYLIVDRQDPLHNLSNGEFERTIKDITAIQGIIDRLDALPAFPKDIVHCPLDNGVNYELQFKNIYQDRGVTITATGCQQVKIDGEEYWAMEPRGKGFRAFIMGVLGMTEQQYSGM
ncbi:hypothetical protein A8990_111145 [Paenibacillus taihuensis]|uniref:Lipoprotein n=1 Tax=Paenibacillus taihuensis TaxID=1156355 RepID=A0A3D9S7X2_9BACL|nr:hypothetical protein [Paenibacillus taihuensis]REE86248.1 hypothetical protein A8990_111145 [Paenibacillus taihuensis]